MAVKVRLPRVFVQLIGKKFTGSLAVKWQDGETVIYFSQGLPLNSPDLLKPFGRKIEEVRLGSDTPGAQLRPVNPFSLIWTGIRQYDLSLLLEEAGELVGPHIRLRDGSDAYVSRFSLPESLKVIPSLMTREPFSHMELKTILHLEDDDILRVLYAFASCSLLESDKPIHSDEVLEFRSDLLRKYYSSKEQDPFELLGVGRQASAKDIDNAFRSLARRFHPDAVAAKGLSEWRREAEELFGRLSEAYTLLSNEEERLKLLNKEETQEISGVMDSELSFQKGRILLKRKEYAKAAEEFKKALELVPDEAIYLAHYAWASYMAAETKSDVRTSVLGMLHKATSLAPRLAIAHYFLGRVLTDANLLNDAIEEMEKAARLDENLIEASREARVLRRRQIRRRQMKQNTFTDKIMSFLHKE